MLKLYALKKYLPKLLRNYRVLILLFKCQIKIHPKTNKNILNDLIDLFRIILTFEAKKKI